MKIDRLMIMGIVFCLPVVWSFLQPHFFHLHDFTHVTRLVELERGLIDGQFPVRWSENLGYGYGMPQFSFYGSLFYYEALLFRLVGVSYVWSIKLAVVLQIIISFLALYGLGKILWGKWGGLLTGIVGIYAPYRLVDMYVRGAFAELSGITWIAMSFYAVILWVKKPTWSSAIIVAISGTMLTLSHTLMALIGVPFIAVWLCYWVVEEKRWFKYWSHLIIMGFLICCLPAFFVLPALIEKSYTQADKLTSGFSNYNFHFLYIRQLWQSKWGYGGSILGLNDDLGFEVGKINLVIIALMSVATTYYLLKRNKKVSLHFLLLSLLWLSLFLTIFKSKFIWDLLPIMAYIQFPWRFLSVAIILVALLVGSSLVFLPEKFKGVYALLIGVVLIVTQTRFARPESFLSDDGALYYTDSQSIQTKMSGIIPDFLPNTATSSADLLVRPINKKNRYIFDKSVNPVIEVSRGHEFLLSFESLTPVTFTARIFDFPGWQLYLNGKPITHQITPEGMITANIPAQTNTAYLTGRFNETPLRLIADIITLVGIVVVFRLIYIENYEVKKHA